MATDYRPLLKAVLAAQAQPPGQAMAAWTEAHNAVIDQARKDLAALASAVEQVCVTTHDAEIVTNLTNGLDGLLATYRMVVPTAAYET